MSLQFQSISVCGLIDRWAHAQNEACFEIAFAGAPPTVGMLHFAGFCLDRRGHTLQRQGADQHLEPLAFALLCYLVDHRDRVVSKRELLEQVWPTRFVAENVVARCVMKVRRALQAPEGEPQLISTVHRIGYRFIAALEHPGGRAHTARTPGGCARRSGGF